MDAQMEAYKTPQEYLAIEEKSDLRYEWCNGQVIERNVRSTDHNTVLVNLGGMVWTQLRKSDLQVWIANQRVRVGATAMVAYPDAIVACPPHEWDEELPHTLLNPRVLFEVLSPSTEKYDMGEKFSHYRRIASLTDYILIASERIYVEHRKRQENGDWLLHIADSLDDVLILENIDCALPLSQLYERLKLPQNFGSARPCNETETR